jgi:hypothetical protein
MPEVIAAAHLAPQGSPCQVERGSVSSGAVCKAQLDSAVI